MIKITRLFSLAISVEVKRFLADSGSWEVNLEKGWVGGKCPNWRKINKVEAFNPKAISDIWYLNYTSDLQGIEFPEDTSCA